MARSTYKIYDSSKQAWNAMYRSIETAKKSIYWEVYIFLDDRIGSKFFDLLEEKSKAGLDVKLIIDYWGSFALSKKRVEQLKKAGVDIHLFQEKKSKKFKGFWKRFEIRVHRKVLIVDEKIGYIGGVNVGVEMENWLDIQMSVRGKVVRSLLRAFAKLYIKAGGDKKEVKHLLKYKYRAMQDEVDLIYDHPRENYSRARKKYAEALTKARERVILFSPYYFPDKEFIKALWNAKKRGIRVDLLIPFRTDLRYVTYAAYAWFSLTRAIGVKIHLTDKMMHGKGVIVDDDWAMIGSSNIDHVSFYTHYEANIQVKNKRVVKKLKRILTGWMKNSRSLEDVKWNKRGRWEKTKAKLAKKGYNFWFNIKE